MFTSGLLRSVLSQGLPHNTRRLCSTICFPGLRVRHWRTALNSNNSPEKFKIHPNLCFPLLALCSNKLETEQQTFAKSCIVLAGIASRQHCIGIRKLICFMIIFTPYASSEGTNRPTGASSPTVAMGWRCWPRENHVLFKRFQPQDSRDPFPCFGCWKFACLPRH